MSQPSSPTGALGTCTYSEVSPIFLGQNIAKSDILGQNETETMFMMFFTPNIVILMFLGSVEAILKSFCILSGYLTFMYRFQSIKRADILGCCEHEVTFLGYLKIS